MSGRAWMLAIAAGVGGAAAAIVGGRFPGHAAVVAGAFVVFYLLVALLAGRMAHSTRAPLDVQVRRLYALHEVTCAVGSVATGQAGLEAAVETVRASLGARVAAFLMPAGGDSCATCVAAAAVRTGFRSLSGASGSAPETTVRRIPAPAPQSAPALWHAVEGGRAEVVADVDGWLPEVMRTGRMDVALLAGAMAGGRTCGALVVGFSGARQPPDGDVDFACQAAHVVGVAAANLRLLGEAGAQGRSADRRRIAADLHDGPAQTLVLLKLKAETALAHRGQARSAAMADALRSIAAGAQDGLDEVRDCIRGLRPPETQRADLLPALTAVCDRWAEMSGIDLDIETDGGEALPLPPDVQGDVLHIVREALANVTKHACARRVVLRLRLDERELTVSVADDGLGFDTDRPPPSGHYGLGILRERAAAIGGRLDIRSRSGRGTEVVLRVPASASPALLSAHG